MNVERYLERIGLEPEAVTEPDLETLGRLQAAHVTSVPFETLSVSAATREEWEPSGVPDSPAARYEKVVEQGRGGICYELNEPFYRRSRRMPRGRPKIRDFRDHENRRFSNDLTPGLKPTTRDTNH